MIFNFDRIYIPVLHGCSDKDYKFRLLHGMTCSCFTRKNIYMCYTTFHSAYGRLKYRILTELVTNMDSVK